MALARRAACCGSSRELVPRAGADTPFLHSLFSALAVNPGTEGRLLGGRNHIAERHRRAATIPFHGPTSRKPAARAPLSRPSIELSALEIAVNGARDLAPLIVLPNTKDPRPPARPAQPALPLPATSLAGSLSVKQSAGAAAQHLQNDCLQADVRSSWRPGRGAARSRRIARS
jgi:hypothetical protein